MGKLILHRFINSYSLIRDHTNSGQYAKPSETKFLVSPFITVNLDADGKRLFQKEALCS